jgi:hypothetical protein
MRYNLRSGGGDSTSESLSGDTPVLSKRDHEEFLSGASGEKHAIRENALHADSDSEKAKLCGEESAILESLAEDTTWNIQNIQPEIDAGDARY